MLQSACVGSGMISLAANPHRRLCVPDGRRLDLAIFTATAHLFEPLRQADRHFTTACIASASSFRGALQPADRSRQLADITASAHLRQQFLLFLQLLQPANQRSGVASFASTDRVWERVQPVNRRSKVASFAPTRRVGVRIQPANRRSEVACHVRDQFQQANRRSEMASFAPTRHVRVQFQPGSRLRVVASVPSASQSWPLLQQSHPRRGVAGLTQEPPVWIPFQ